MTLRQEALLQGIPRGSDGKESACNAGDCLQCSIPELGRTTGEGNGYLLQHSCLENSMNRGTGRAAVHGLARSRTWLSDQHAQSKHRHPDSQEESIKAWSDEQEFSFSKPMLSWLLPEFCRNQTSNSGKQVWTLLESGENCGMLQCSSSIETPGSIQHQPNVLSPQHGGPVWTHLLIFQEKWKYTF